MSPATATFSNKVFSTRNMHDSLTRPEKEKDPIASLVLVEELIPARQRGVVADGLKVGACHGT